MGGLSIWHWLIVLVIVVLVFGTKRLKNVGKDVGEAVKGFKQGVGDDGKPSGELSDQSQHADRDSTIHDSAVRDSAIRDSAAADSTVSGNPRQDDTVSR